MEWSLTGLPLPIILRPPSPLTDDDLLVLSTKNHALRIEKTADGDLRIMTPVGGQGGRWEAFVIGELQLWAREDGRGTAFSSSAGFNLRDGSILSPDASWVSHKCWNSLTPAQRNTYPPLCPEFILEILSVTDSRKQLQEKMALWINNGAQLAWLIDP